MTTFLEVVVIDAVANGVHFPSHGEQVSVISSGFDVAERPEQQKSCKNHIISHLFIRSAEPDSSLHKIDVIGHIVSHLRGRSRGAVIIINHAVIELSGHSDDHVVEIRIEVLAFRNVQAFRRLVMVASQDVVNVIESSRTEFDLGEISGPHSSVGVFGFFLGVIRRVDAIVNETVTVFPFLVIVLFKVVMGRVD